MGYRRPSPAGQRVAWTGAPAAGGTMAQFGVYYGIVSNTADPEASGRVQIQTPTVMAATGQWAPVCTAVGASPNAALPIGSTVLVAFEGGDVSRPVVLGTVQK